jgi:hypothetical protein
VREGGAGLWRENKAKEKQTWLNAILAASKSSLHRRSLSASEAEGLLLAAPAPPLASPEAEAEAEEETEFEEEEAGAEAEANTWSPAAATSLARRSVYRAHRSTRLNESRAKAVP